MPQWKLPRKLQYINNEDPHPFLLYQLNVVSSVKGYAIV